VGRRGFKFFRRMRLPKKALRCKWFDERTFKCMKKDELACKECEDFVYGFDIHHSVPLFYYVRVKRRD